MLNIAELKKKRDKLAWDLYRVSDDNMQILQAAGVGGPDDMEAASESLYVLNANDPEDIEEAGPLYLKDHVIHTIIGQGFLDQASEMLVFEELAALEHRQWAHWTQYMLKVLDPLLGAEDVGDAEQVEAHEALARWLRQIETPYSELSEKEKDSDREWARAVLSTIRTVRDIDKIGLKVTCPKCRMEGIPFPHEDPVVCGNCGHSFRRW